MITLSMILPLIKPLKIALALWQMSSVRRAAFSGIKAQMSFRIWRSSVSLLSIMYSELITAVKAETTPLPMAAL